MHAQAVPVALALILAPLGAADAKILIGTAAQITGDYSGLGEQVERGAEMAVADLNKAGGVLGELVRLILVDDYCSGDQAVAAARKLVDAGVVFVAGHPCSGAAIPASKVYEEAAILMISSTGSTPKLTDEGGPNIFRMAGRDDQIARVAGQLLADRWGDAQIAIVHDGQVYGQGLAEEVKTQLNGRGVHEAMYEAIVPGQLEYIDLILKMQAAGVDVLYYGGYSTDAALAIRQARDRGYDLQSVSGDSVYTEQFWLVAGPAANGALFTSPPDPREKSEAAEVVRRFRAANYEPEGGTLHTYASVQIWAQAVEKVGTTELDAVIEALRRHRFDTVVGRISFDDNGDVTGTETYIWYV